MKKYRISHRIALTANPSFEIEANSWEEAEKLAQELVDKQDTPWHRGELDESEIDWEYDPNYDECNGVESRVSYNHDDIDEDAPLENKSDYYDEEGNEYAPEEVEKNKAQRV